jgi:hypothetical protein
MGKTTLERDFHMVGGNGESSYAANSMFQVPSILSFLIPYLSLSGTQN